MARDIEWSHSVTVSVAVPYGWQGSASHFLKLNVSSWIRSGWQRNCLTCPVRIMFDGWSKKVQYSAWRRRNTESVVV